MVLKIYKWYIDLGKLLYQVRLYFAVHKADRLARLLNKRHVVIVFAGRPRVYMKADLKDLIARRVIFKKGVTMEQLEKMAVYKTR